MKILNDLKCSFYLTALASLPALLLTACSGSSSGAIASSPSSAVSYTQVERIARPAINEGLIGTNTNLNLWNSVPPSADLSTSGTAIVNEAAGTLGALYTYGTANGLVPAPTASVVSGFLPDVMRIDLTKVFSGSASNVGTIDSTMAYAGCVSSTKSVLCGGRKLRDNTAQITVLYLVNGGAATTSSTGLNAIHYNPSNAPPTLLSGFPYEAAPN